MHRIRAFRTFDDWDQKCNVQSENLPNVKID